MLAPTGQPSLISGGDSLAIIHCCWMVVLKFLKIKLKEAEYTSTAYPLVAHARPNRRHRSLSQPCHSGRPKTRSCFREQFPLGSKSCRPKLIGCKKKGARYASLAYGCDTCLIHDPCIAHALFYRVYPVLNADPLKISSLCLTPHLVAEKCNG